MTYGQHAPEQDVHRAHRVLRNGASSRPTCSRGGPQRASAFAAATSAGDGPGSRAQTASTSAAYGRAGVEQGEPQQLEARAVLLQQREPVGEVGRGGVLEHRGQVVGQLGVRRTPRPPRR